MMRYSYSIHHTPGKDIGVADALSRSPINIWRMKSGWPIKNELSAEAKAFRFLRYEMSVIDGLLMRNSRIYIPKSLRSKVLNSLHESHLGIEKCRDN
ncbi:K02A2.6-like [Cordylochernes scorpioides]|uniref:K02A2.6-like n=1 Tax=Cordylochernes scorpioides TaxID=51811 RepID=A0ABY6LW19_9ARAC|nr:K02A2.6-like [Cordylochernes scorpioides]